ncbi:MAG: echA19, partial [Acidimicrobiales bacterium]|nr:echA19 [Acidimicrobiales bacterium]
MPDQPHLIVERDGPVLTVTLNRPEAKNAFSPRMLVAAADAWKLLDEDPDLRVGILTGAGGDFCSGMDLKALAGGIDPEDAQRMGDDPDLHWKALLRHFRPSKPIIAAVEGYCVAGGTEILQATEIRVAGASAQFGIAEVRRGLFPLGGSTVRLQRQIAFTHAADLLLTGRLITATEARD